MQFVKPSLLQTSLPQHSNNFASYRLNVTNFFGHAHELKQRLVKGLRWSLIGSVLSKILVLIASITCARILGKHLFGEFSVIRSTIALFVTVGSAGLGVTASKFISQKIVEEKESLPNLIEIINVLSVLFALSVAIIIYNNSELISNYLKSPDLTEYIKYSSFIIFLLSLCATQTGILVGFESFRLIALINLTTGVFEFTGLVIGSYLYGIEGAIIGYGISFIVMYILNAYTIKIILSNYNIEKKPLKSLKLLKEILNFSIPATLSGLIVTPVFWISKSFVTRCNGFDEIAIYEVSEQWRVILLFIPSVISQVLLPILSSLNQNNRISDRSSEILRINILINATISSIFCIVVILMSNIIMKLYGHDFNDTSTLIVISISTIFTSISNVVGLAIASINKMWCGFGFNLGWGLCMTTCAYIFTDLGYGSLGIAFALLISYVVHTVIQIIYLAHNK